MSARDAVPCFIPNEDLCAQADCSLEGVSATACSAVAGGAVWSLAAVRLDASSITHSRAHHGGAVWLEGPAARLIAAGGAVMFSNQAYDTGGAVQAVRGAEVLLGST